MSGRITFLLTTVILMFILAGYITDSMRSVNTKNANGFQKTAEKMQAEVGHRMVLQKNEFIRINHAAVSTSNGVTVKGRENDRERIFAQHQRDQVEMVCTRSNNDLGDALYYTESASDTANRKICHMQFQQSALANEGLDKAINNNHILAQEACGTFLAIQSTTLQDQAQIAHNLQNQQAKLNHSVVRSANELLKEVNKLDLDKENARRQREAAKKEEETAANRAERTDSVDQDRELEFKKLFDIEHRTD